MVAAPQAASAAGHQKPPQVYFFGTCVVDAIHPSAGLSAMKLLRAAGIEPRFPGGQTCCGQPAFNSGYRSEAYKVAAAQLDLFPDPIPIIVLSSSCAEMIREQYHVLFEGSPLAEKASDIAGRVREWAEFYAGITAAKLPDQGEPIRIYCHTSCHGKAKRGQTLELISRLDKVEVLSITHALECCGFGGAFSVKHSGISGRMAHNKASEIAASGADALVSNEASCLMNIQSALEKQGHKMPCYHLADFLWRRTHA